MPILRYALTICTLAFGIGLPSLASAESCIKHDSRRGGNSIDVTVANRCGKVVNVNVCINIAQRKPIPIVKQAHQVPDGQSFTFSFVDFDNSGFKYNIKGCGADSGGRVDNCPAHCPELTIQTEKNVPESSDSSHAGVCKVKPKEILLRESQGRTCECTYLVNCRSPDIDFPGLQCTDLVSGNSVYTDRDRPREGEDLWGCSI